MQLYEFGKLIGIGSFGQVFLCRHKREDKYYVVKKLRMMELKQKDRENIQNQLKLLQKLRHPNIVSYKDSFTDKDGNLCIVMVYCEAGDMYKRIINTKEKGENFKQAQILDWITQTALAIHYLHNQKILHRDLKSQNLFLKKDEKIKDEKSKQEKGGKQQRVQKVRLGDFGIAKVLDSAQDLTSTCIGTPYYMAPQIFKYKSYSYKCDIWSFGVIIYQMCNLRLPFQAQSYTSLAVKIMAGSYPSITPTYSKQLRDLISSMLSLKPTKRPTIVQIINKPFIKKRVQKYMVDMFSRNSSANDNDDIYLDTLRQQAVSLGISLNGPGSQEDLLKKYPSSKDLQRRWTRNILSRRGEEEQTEFKKQFHQKRKSLLERDSLSLEKNIRKKQDTSSSSTKALNLAYDLKDEKQAFVDHQKKKWMEKQIANKTLQDRRNLHDQVMKSQLNQQKYMQQQNIRRFRMQEDYSMSDQPAQSEQSSINQQIIQQQSDQDLHELTTTNFNFEQQQQAPQNYNKSYYKILDQIKVLKHICQTGIGTSKYLRAYNAVNNGCNKAAILEILGPEYIGYWHLLDQIMFNDNILKTLSKQ